MNLKFFFVPFLSIMIIAYSFAFSSLYESLVELKEAKNNLQIALDRYKKSQAEYQVTLDNFENFLFVKSAIQQGFDGSHRVSDDCFMKNDLAFCKRDATPRQFNKETGDWEYKYTGQLADFPKIVYRDALDEGTT